jgi:endoglucanase
MRVRGLRRCGQFRAPLRVLLCALASVVALVVGNGSGRATTPDFIHADGTRLVDGSGENFAIKGINLGNWLVPEGYMFKFKHALSPTEIAGVVATLVGPDQA